MTEVSQMPTTVPEPSTNSFQFEDRPSSLRASGWQPGVRNGYEIQNNINILKNLCQKTLSDFYNLLYDSYGNCKMNPYLQPNITATNALKNPSVNVGLRPVLDAKNPESALTRMQQPRPNERNNNSYNHTNYQQHQPQSDMHRNRPPNQQILPQQQQQQNNALRDHLQQQINIHRNDSQQQNNAPQNHPQPPNREPPRVFLRQDSGKLQINPNNEANVSNRYNQGMGIPIESQRTQMPAQVRFSNPGQSIRPPFSNPNSVTFLNQSPNNYIEASRIPDSRMQSNSHLFQNENSGNYKSQILRDGSINRGRNSIDGTDPHAKLNENTSSKTCLISQEETSNGVRPETERKPDLMNEQTTLSPPENKSEQNSLMPEKNDNKKSGSEISEKKTMSSEKKVKEKNQKEGKTDNIKDVDITSGMVRKNIKFFEDNDTARKPLTPTTATVQKRERVTNIPSDVIKSEFHSNSYESGVDETPVVHPNLGSTSQVPRKVAKIPRMRGKKNFKKQRSETISKLLKCSHAGKPLQKIQTFSSKEELLAFFESTKSWRKINRYGKSAAGQNAAKDKIVYKPTTNGDISPKKTPSKLPAPSKVNPPASPTKTPLKSPGTPGAKSLPKTPDGKAPSTPLIKKVPMNKIQVGAAPSPNLKTIRSKVGSLANTTHKPGGGNIKIESHKIDLSKAQPRIEAKNDQYKPSGGDKKIEQVKLQWSAKSKVGSLENSTYKPGGGDKKIESVKLDFKEKAKPKVGSKDNVKHVPGGGNVKIENQKLEFRAQSKVGSLDNVKHKPGGGDIKIFDDKTYLRQISGSEGRASGTQNYRDLSTPDDIKSISNPGTPARKTTNIKIRKTMTLHSFEEAPKIEKTTEVIVTSQTPKKDSKSNRSSMKQQVTLTYSKISTSQDDNKNEPVGIIKIPARNDAPKPIPNSNKSGTFHNTEVLNPVDGNKNKFYDKYAVPPKPEQYNEMQKVRHESPGLPDCKLKFRNDSGMSKFLQDEMAAQEKIGEMWRERNVSENKPTLSSNQLLEGKSKEPVQTFSLEDGKSRSNYKPQDLGFSATTDQPDSKLYATQNLQAVQYSQNVPATQNQQKETSQQKVSSPYF